MSAVSLGLRSTAATVAPPANPPVWSASRAVYVHDLISPFGLTVDTERLAGAGHVTHTQLVDLLVADLPADFGEPDLIILSHALPDLNQHQAVACHLNHLLGGRAVSFAVLGQGLGAPFMALRIALAYTASGRFHAPMIAVLEQTTLPYQDDVVHGGTRLIDSGVLLAFDRRSGPWRVASVREFGPAERIDARLAELASAAARPLAVLGPWTDPDLDPAVASHRVAPGSYGTSVWLELGSLGAQWAGEYDTVLLCDTDPRTGITYVAVFDRRAPTTDQSGGTA